MKKQITKSCLLLVSLALLIFTSTSCADKEAENTGEIGNFELIIDSELDDFTTFSGANVTVTPEGYYIIKEGFLYYVSPDFTKNTIVCSKPECIHNEPDVDNLYEYTACDAYFQSIEADVDYYDGFLYIKAPDGRNDVIYKVSLDGSERTVLYRGGQFINMFCIYGGNAYLGEKSYTSEGAVLTVNMFPISEPDNVVTLFETDEYPESELNRLRFYDKYCYFYLYDPGGLEEDGSSVHLKVDLTDGSIEQMFEQANCQLVLGDYGILAQVDEYIQYNPIEYKSTYYHIPPGSKEKILLTQEDFASVGSGDMLYSIDDKYIYFGTCNGGVNAVAPDEQKVRVYDYEGELAAEIPAEDFWKFYYILPGTDRYMFIQTMTGIDFEFYYVDKEEFDGGIVEAHKIELAERG